MLDNFSRKSVDHEQCLKKKQNLAIDITASNGGQGMYMRHVSFTLPPPVAALSIRNITFFKKMIRN
jgi:hypothetical protein